ncbi:hypothetical protein [Bordetella sp. FB-8]|uniref:hypothetical protein n=1 Tax=Bordetella sp. FB-8 TaxID=1159870 RepID=UPI0018CB6CE1|nr:hypothetical protein [Bordetella sp. FB-8]
MSSTMRRLAPCGSWATRSVAARTAAPSREESPGTRRHRRAHAIAASTGSPKSRRHCICTRARVRGKGEHRAASARAQHAIGQREGKPFDPCVFQQAYPYLLGLPQAAARHGRTPEPAVRGGVRERGEIQTHCVCAREQGR